MVVKEQVNGKNPYEWFECLISTKEGVSGLSYQLYQVNRHMNKAVWHVVNQVFWGTHVVMPSSQELGFEPETNV